MCGDGPQPSTDRCGGPARADQHGVQRNHQTDDDRSPGDLVEEIGRDHADGTHRVTHRRLIGDLVGGVAHRRIAQQQNGEAADHDAHADPTQRLPSPVAGEVHRTDVEADDDHEQDHARQLDDADCALDLVDDVAFEQHQLARVVGQAVAETFFEPEIDPEHPDELAEVEHHHAVVGLDRRVVTASDGDESLVRGLVDLAPQTGGGVAAEHPIDGLGSTRPNGRSHEPAEADERIGELAVDLVGDVDALEQLVGDVLRERSADLVVGQQFVADLHPVLGLEHLLFDPCVQRAEDGDHRGQHDHRPHHPPGSTAPFGRAGLLGRWGDRVRFDVGHRCCAPPLRRGAFVLRCPGSSPWRRQTLRR